MNELVAVNNGVVKTTSLIIAEKFGKNHRDVLRAIRNLECGEEFTLRNFALSYKINELANGRKDPYYEITKDGFMFLVMGFTGKEAAEWKVKFIEAFNKMAEAIANKLPSMTYTEVLAAVANNLVAMESKVENIDNRLTKIEGETQDLLRRSLSVVETTLSLPRVKDTYDIHDGYVTVRHYLDMKRLSNRFKNTRWYGRIIKDICRKSGIDVIRYNGQVPYSYPYHVVDSYFSQLMDQNVIQFNQR